MSKVKKKSIYEEEHSIVNKPAHYNTGKVECIDAIEASLSKEEFIGYLRGNVLKYNWRCRYKGGAVDVEKGIWYATKLAEKLKDAE